MIFFIDFFTASSCKTKWKKLRHIFIGFPRIKDTDLNPQQWHHIPGVDEVYHGNDNQLNDSTTILERLVSRISAVHSSIGNLTLSLNVFLFLLLLFWCLQNALCKCGHENAHTKIWKKKKRSPYQYVFNTWEMPLVISCRFLGKEVLPVCPQVWDSHRWEDQTREWPRLLISHRKAIFIVSTRANYNYPGLTMKRIKPQMGLYLFYWFVSSFSFF